MPGSIVQESCLGTFCHHAGESPAGNLDLSSPCVADRLVGVAASCRGRLLIDPQTVERSFLLEKLERNDPECGGESMPYDSHLSAHDLSCMQSWVRAVLK